MARNVDLPSASNEASQSSGPRLDLKSQMSSTKPKEFFCLEDQTSNNQAEDDECANGEEDEDDENRPTVRWGNRTRANLENSQFSSKRLHQHAPSCMASKLVNVELSAGEPSRYHHQPHCFYQEHQHQLQFHKQTCALHRMPMAMSNQKLFRNLISSSQMHTNLPQVGDFLIKSNASADPRLLVQRRRHMRPRSPMSGDKSKYLLAEFQHQRPRSSSTNNIQGNFRNLTRPIIQTAAAAATTTSGRLVVDLGGALEATRTPSDRKKTTIKFISQLYFLIHLSAMISLLLHHKNLVSDESGVRQPMQMLMLHEQQHIQTPPLLGRNSATNEIIMNNNKNVKEEEDTTGSGSARAPRQQPKQQHRARHRHRATTTNLVNGNVNNQDENETLPTLPVPQVLFQANYHATQQLSPRWTSGSSDASQFNQRGHQFEFPSHPPPKRNIRSSFDTDEAQLDAKSSDILVRLVGRTHARCALQYFLGYLLSSSVTVMLLLWVARICTTGEPTGSTITSDDTTLATVGRQQVETRQDCTPVLIGSISLGLIQLIVIGLDIADNVDWLAAIAAQSDSGAPPPIGHSELDQRHWPIFLPLLQFVFVSLLMQFILAMVARNRDLIWPTTAETASVIHCGSRRQDSQRQRCHKRKCLGDSLQNIALAHLLVTHILLWLMRLNSISLFQPQQQVTAPFVMLMPHQPQTTISPATSTSTTTTTRPPAVTSSSRPLQTTQKPSADKNSDQSNYAEEATTPDGRNERNNGQALEGERKREKVLPSLRNAREPQLVHIAARVHAASESTTAARPSGHQLPHQQHNTTKIERDLRTAVERRPLAPLKSDQLHTTLPPPLTSSSPRPSQAPVEVPLRAQDVAALDKSKGQPGLLLRQPNITANLFKSSLPKRMTAFRQGRPNQRVNLVPSPPATRSTAALPPFAGSSISTPPSSTSTSTATRPPHDQPNGGPDEKLMTPNLRHKVHILINRDLSSPQSIDLTAVIPVNQGDDSSIAVDDDVQAHNEELGEEPPKQRPFESTSSAERPFPSVDDDPPTRPTTSSTSMSTTTTGRPVHLTGSAGDSGEREPNESAHQVRRWLKEVGAHEKTAAAATTTKPNEEAEEGLEEEDETELDLDALLPPVPNYNETSGDDENLKAIDPEPSIRKSRQVAPARRNKTQPSPEGDAFMFNEAASNRVLDVTSTTTSTMSSTLTSQISSSPNEQLPRGPPEAINSTWPVTTGNKTTNLDSIKSEALTASSTEFKVSHPQQQQRQPTFADFLLPIVQQYHILVLTILFNMWLDGMQREANKNRHQQLQQHRQALLVQGATSRPVPAGGVCSSPSETSLVSNSSGSIPNDHAIDSCSLSQGSSTRHLVSAMELAKHKQRARKMLKRSAKRARPMSDHDEDDELGLSSRTASGRRFFWDDERPRRVDKRPESASSSVCSVFFGLIVVSGSLIVILIGVDLLSLLVQCLIQLAAVFICLVGLCVVWRIKKSREGPTSRRMKAAVSGSRHQAVPLHGRRGTSATANSRGQQQAPASTAHGLQSHRLISHKSSFHYLFLLAAYYCGISIALNLGQQHQLQRLFPIQVIQFLQRLMLTGQHHEPSDLGSSPFEPRPQAIAINCQLLFYVALSLKGLLLIVQVTMQTLLIRSSWCWSSARAKLRQFYTFLMFANLSLWALEICDQQQRMQLAKFQQLQAPFVLDQSQPQQLQRHHLAQAQNFELLTLDGLTRFAGSVVTLSHLYHGLVFMQH